MESRVRVNRYLDALTSHIDWTRGLNIRGTVPRTTYKAIFQQQSLPWKSIVERCTTQCQYSTHRFLKQASDYVAGTYGGARLMEHLIMPAFRERIPSLRNKVEELLWPYLFSHPTMCDTRFSAASSTGRFYPTTNDLWETLLGPNASPAELAAARAMDTADA